MPQVRNSGSIGKSEEGAICERFIQFYRGEAMYLTQRPPTILGLLLGVLSISFEIFFPIEKVLICLV